MTTVVAKEPHSLALALTDGSRAVALTDGSRAVALTDGSLAVALTDGSLAVALTDGSLAVARADGSLAVALHPNARAVAYNGGVAYQYGDMHIVAASDGYTLLRSPDGLYYAGCRGPFTREQALAHWDREDDRACLFTLAILMCDQGEKRRVR